ncbi:MAG: M23 family metallopeptidase [Bacteroidia bacterium]|nr:M23 family metallopeptidase [Bacteroidia bacterium]
MEAGLRWLYSASLLAVTAILLSFILSFPDQLRAKKGQSAMELQLRQVQWNLYPIDSLEITDMPALRPVSDSFPLVSGFGMRKHPILNIERLHAGIDFAAPKGARVMATASGVIERISRLADSSTFGIHIVILHDSSAFFSGRYRTLYAHLSGVKVKPGDRVEQGQTIGFVGTTGRSTAAHLHYEVHLDQEALDPLDYLPGGNRKIFEADSTHLEQEFLP